MTAEVLTADAWAGLPPLTGSVLLDPWRIRHRLALIGQLEPPPPRRPTPAEEVLWAELERRQVGWRREYATGPYRLDFFHEGARLAVEVDGASHWGRAQARKDGLRDEWHERRDIRTHRVSNREVLEDLVPTLTLIDAIMAERLRAHAVVAKAALLLIEAQELHDPEPVESEPFADVAEAVELEIRSYAAAAAACVTILPEQRVPRRPRWDLLRR